MIGPAFPLSFMLPPEGVSAVKSNGNDDVKEKSFTVTSTLSYIRCGIVEFVCDTVSFPLFTFSFATERFG